MTGTKDTNLLSDPLLTISPPARLTLPGVLAALARDGVDGFVALRPHQAASWHMFLVQLAGLALHRAGRSDIPENEADWAALLRGLTPGFARDEPWCLVVEDTSKPAFLQPAIPEGVTLANPVETADGLDLLITSRNHDLKQMIARAGAAEDWIYALVSLQTGEGYGGAGNQGVVRMNGGSSSRAMVTLAPLSPGKGRAMRVRPGAWFRRDLRVLLETRDRVLDETSLPYADDGIGLTWLEPWPEGAQLTLQQLDIWFIEVCRRVRLDIRDGRLRATKGTSRETRIAAKMNKGNLEDPWAPAHTTEGKSLTIGDEGDFDYEMLTRLLFSGEWTLPLLARRARFEGADTPLAIVAQALARGNSKTGGYRSRIVPIEGRRLTAEWGDAVSQETLRRLAQEQVATIRSFDKALGYALVLAAASGEAERISRDSYRLTRAARNQLGRFADTIFFDHLWRRFAAEAQDEAARTAAKTAFARELWASTQALFEQSLPDMPCHSLYRHRADVRARRALLSRELREGYPHLFERQDQKEVADHG
ncbi:CRISPR-associated protein, Cse1 family [Rhizobium sp. RU20A]|uniref:CRISPR-associated protein Cse1 n=1 Tax=Rhizobium sp. RU20A TaxID=1907412 RepID=UPI000955B387|nr:CRISPR-associated protein Cse1 [Rhizobium sp. RU20A]SIR18992.1 CRISPR-associated protein, Cse1 family [Rhizobium sp. RU20A]